MERCRPVDALVGQLCAQPRKFLHALFERGGKALLLFVELVYDRGASPLQLVVEIAILVDDGLGDFVQAAVGNAELHRIADGAADEPAQDIALVGRWTA